MFRSTLSSPFPPLLQPCPFLTIERKRERSKLMMRENEGRMSESESDIV
uniref:Uncharacterized protein n=1 Tax=Medicago truncatula TaxID=3880 RepID=I3SNT2_MEDTR|nr:unknown [Medicago truncatula]